MVAECWLSVATIFRLLIPFDFTVTKFFILLSGTVFKVNQDKDLMTSSFPLQSLLS